MEGVYNYKKANFIDDISMILVLKTPKNKTNKKMYEINRYWILC